MMNISQECTHEFERNKGIDSNQCILCRWYPSREKRAKCKFCYAEGCITCIENLLKIKVKEGRENSDISNDTINLRIITLESRINELEQKVMLLKKGKQKT
uniref:Putative ovule protein n=1 Tax=Solanum chacoense TaxID=4108 RepID=A0A0V0IGL8_SOLCH